METVGNIASWTSKRTDRKEIVKSVLKKPMLGQSFLVPSPIYYANLEYCLNKAGSEAAKRFLGRGSKIKCERKWVDRDPFTRNWDVYRHTKNRDDINHREYLCSAKIHGNDPELVSVYWDSPEGIRIEEKIKNLTQDQIDSIPHHYLMVLIDTWNDNKHTLSGGDITTMFKDVLANMEGVFPIKSGGSMYWLPPEQKQRWLDIQDAMKDIIPVQLFSQAGDSTTLDSLFIALEEELEDDIKYLEEIVNENDLSEHALKKRRSKSEKLHAMVSGYKGVLGNRLDGIVQRLSQAENVSLQAGSSAAAIIEDDEIFSDLPF